MCPFFKENGLKREAKSHCVRRAQTAAPLLGNRRISMGWLGIWGTAGTENRRADGLQTTHEVNNN